MKLYRGIKYFLFFLFFVPLHAQEGSNQEEYLQSKMEQIDSLISINKLDRAQSILETTLNTFRFSPTSEDRLRFKLKEAEINYTAGKNEEALGILLNGFENLKANTFSSLNIEYANFLAKIFANTQNFDKAIYYNKIALQKARLIQDTLNITKSLIRLGSFYYSKDQQDSAKIYFRKVTYFPVNEKTETRIANAYNNLGVIAQNQNNFDLAKHWIREALKINMKRNNIVGVAYSNVNIGNNYHYEGDYKNAIENYLEAYANVEVDTTKDVMYLKRIIYENLSVSYDSLGDYKNAYDYLNKSYKIKFKLSNEQLAESIAEVEAKYNLALEEQRTEEEKSKAFKAQVMLYGLTFLTLTLLVLAVIFYKNYKLKEQNKLDQIQNNLQTRIINATIDAKEKERKSIAEILHDSVSALLSSANLHLQASRAQLNGSVPVEINKAQEIVNEASVKIRDLSHELISSVLLKFGLAFAVHDLCEKYSNSELQLVSDDNGIKRYNQKFEIKIYNIIEELINNIIKHSGAKNATINLIERNKEKLLIQIMDDGKGFNVRKERSKDGLGLSHIEARIKIMNGVFNINSKVGEGTSIFISVPIYQHEKAQTA